MATYILFMREDAIVDPTAMAAYQARNRENPPSNGIKPLVIYGQLEALEGDAPDGVVLLEFPDAASARAWYNSDAYQAAIPLRQQAAPYRAFIMEGWTP